MSAKDFIAMLQRAFANNLDSQIIFEAFDPETGEDYRLTYDSWAIIPLSDNIHNYCTLTFAVIEP